MNLNSPLYSGFVSPALCQQLYNAGVSPHTGYHYRQVDGATELRTYAFDKDDYYAAGDKHLDLIMRATIIPAYSLADIAMMIPGNYYLHYNECGYQLMLEKLYSIPEQTADRMPDAFALTLLDGLKRRVLKVQAINNVFQSLNK